MAFIESVEDTIGDFKKSVGDKGFLFIGIGAVVLFVVVLMKQNSKSGEVVVATGITSYPDTVTNADVIISTLQNSIAYTEGELKEDIAGLSEQNKTQYENLVETSNSTQQLIKDTANQTNQYLQDGLKRQEDLLNAGFNGLEGQLSFGFGVLNDGINKVNKNVSKSYEDLADKIHGQTVRIEQNQNANTQALHLATGLQMEQAEMNIRNELKVGNELKVATATKL